MAQAAIDIRKKLDIFEEKIMGRVDEQCAAIAQEVEAFRKQELDKYLNDVLGDTKKYMDAEINEIVTSCAKEVYTKKVALKKNLFDRREAHCQQVFDEARAQLKSFVSSGEYTGFMTQRVRQLGELYRDLEATLLIREADLPMAASLKLAFGGSCNVESSEEIFLGGVILTCSEQGYRVDESLDTALENQKQWFYQQSGMIVSL